MLKEVSPSNLELPKTMVRHYTPGPMDLERTGIQLSDLCKGSQMVLWSVRRWVRSRQSGHALYRDVERAYQLSGIPEGSELMDEWMTLLAHTSSRRVVVQCGCSKDLSCDELLILQCIRSLQGGHGQAAETRLARLLQGPMARVFCRIAGQYAEMLQQAGLKLERLSHLRAAII